MLDVIQMKNYNEQIVPAESQIIQSISNYLSAENLLETESKEFVEIVPITKIINKFFWKISN